MPELADFAVGDQVAVTGHDLLAALELVPPDEQVWFGPTTGAGPPGSSKRPACSPTYAAASDAPHPRRSPPQNDHGTVINTCLPR